MAVALGLVGAAESYWTWYAARVDPSGPPTFSPLLLLYFASGLAFISVAVTMGRVVREPMSERARSLLDVLAGALLVFPIIYLLWTLPLFSTTSAGWHGGPGGVVPHLRHAARGRHALSDDRVAGQALAGVGAAALGDSDRAGARALHVAAVVCRPDPSRWCGTHTLRFTSGRGLVATERGDGLSAYRP